MQNAIAWVMVSLLLVGLGVYMFQEHRPTPSNATRGGPPPGRIANDYPNLYNHADAENASYILVFLLKAPRPMNRPTLARAAENAFHIQFAGSSENRLMIQPRLGLFGVITPSLRLGLISSISPYFDNAELPAALEQEHDPAVRRALQDHTAWLGVDWFGPLPDGGADQAYAQVGKLLAELVGDDVLAVGYTAKAKSLFHAYVSADREVLRGSNPLSLFDVPATAASSETPK